MDKRGTHQCLYKLGYKPGNTKMLLSQKYTSLEAYWGFSKPDKQFFTSQINWKWMQNTQLLCSVSRMGLLIILPWFFISFSQDLVWPLFRRYTHFRRLYLAILNFFCFDWQTSTHSLLWIWSPQIWKYLYALTGQIFIFLTVCSILCRAISRDHHHHYRAQWFVWFFSTKIRLLSAGIILNIISIFCDIWDLQIFFYPPWQQSTVFAKLIYGINYVQDDWNTSLLIGIHFLALHF